MSAEPLPRPPPDVIVRVGLWVRRTIQALADAVTPPELVMLEHMSGVMRTKLIGAAARLDLAEHLARGPLGATELAARTGVDAAALHRLLRGLAALGVVRSVGEGRFERTRFLAVLERGRASASRDFADYWSSRSNVAAWNDYDETLRTGGGAFARVHGRSVWHWFDEHPDEREAFARAMGGLTTQVAPLVAAHYPWAEVQRVCDVGGGRGMLLSELLIHHPHLHGVLCDAPGVIASAESLLAERGVGERVTRVPGSFFEGIPAGCDAYVLKNILHDWDDPTCARILAGCRAVMKPGARVVIVELVLEHDSTDLLGTMSDLHMMVVCDDGKERSRADFTRLLEGAGFRRGRVWDGALAGIVEGVAV
jgi:hypothetical protein